MDTVRSAVLEDSGAIADFQIRCALESENLELNSQNVNKAIQYLNEHKELGQFFVACESGQICGSMLISSENSKVWWILSVYVRPESRRRGHFSRLFANGLEQAKQRNVKSVKLYVEKQNERARKTYEKLQMHVNDQIFYGYDLVYGPNTNLTALKQPINLKYGFTDHCLEAGFQPGLVFGQQAESNLNGRLYLNESGVSLGFCEYFTEFSDWRFGDIIYLNVFAAKKGQQKEVLQCLLKRLYSQSKIKVVAMRFVIRKQELETVKQLQPSMHYVAYDVMEITL